jgi:hypothetical protein
VTGCRRLRCQLCRPFRLDKVINLASGVFVAFEGGPGSPREADVLDDVDDSKHNGCCQRVATATLSARRPPRTLLCVEISSDAWFDQRVSFRVESAVAGLRMFDVAATKRFYVDYLGCSLDWEEGGGDGPVYMQVSRDKLCLHFRRTTTMALPAASFWSWCETSTRCMPSSTSGVTRFSIRRLDRDRVGVARCR